MTGVCGRRRLAFFLLLSFLSLAANCEIPDSTKPINVAATDPTSSNDNPSAVGSSPECIGPQGPAGEKGLQGNPGPQGPPGLNGKDGKVGSGPQGLQGPQGPPGTNGKDGIDGQQGPQGPQGSQGPPGANGKNGVDGQQGLQGSPGLQGPPGTNGKNGADGQQGPPGPPGSNGKDGADGQQGPQGPQGPPGVNGKNGADGQQGPQGPMGPAGSQGPAGTSNPPGSRKVVAQTFIDFRGLPVFSVQCDGGYSLIGGSYDPQALTTSDNSPPFQSIISTFDNTDLNLQTWQVQLVNPSGLLTGRLIVYGICEANIVSEPVENR